MSFEIQELTLILQHVPSFTMLVTLLKGIYVVDENSCTVFNIQVMVYSYRHPLSS